MQRFVVAVFLTAALRAQQPAQLHDGEKSTRVPPGNSPIGPSDINSQLQVLNERLYSVQATVARIEEGQTKLVDKAHDLELKLTAIQAREQGRSDQSDSSFRWFSSVVVPLLVAVVGSGLTVVLTRTYLKPPDSSGAPSKAPKSKSKNQNA